MGGSREKEIEAMIAEEKILEIVQKYIEKNLSSEPTARKQWLRYRRMTLQNKN